MRGVIDSGADLSAMPIAYASILGYTTDDLERGEAQQVQGSLETWRAADPITAVMPGAPEIRFSLHPTFVTGALNVLWGRLDFMQVWNVAFRDPEQMFELQWRGA